MRSVAKWNADFESTALDTSKTRPSNGPGRGETHPERSLTLLASSLTEPISRTSQSIGSILEKVMGQISIHNLPKLVRSCFATPHSSWSKVGCQKLGVK